MYHYSALRDFLLIMIAPPAATATAATSAIARESPVGTLLPSSGSEGASVEGSSSEGSVESLGSVGAVVSVGSVEPCIYAQH